MRLFSARFHPALLSFSAVILVALMLWPGLISDLNRTTDFMPHGFCFQWETDILTLHVVSDLTIWVAYMGLSALLGISALRYRAAFGRLPLWIALAFGSFIFFCGLTHLMGVIVIWNPLYWLDGGVKALTAVASIGTFIGVIIARKPIDQILSASAQRDALLGEQRRAVGQLQLALATKETDLTTLTAEITRQREERRQLMANLEQSNQLYRALAANFPAGAIALVRPDLTYIFADGESIWSNGQTAAAYRDQRVGATLSVELRAAITARYQAAFQGAQQAMQFIWKERTYDLHLAPIAELNGQIDVVLAVYHDITARVQVEQALQQSEDRFAKAFHASPVAMSITRASDSGIIEINDSFQRLFGYHRAEVLNQSGLMLHIFPDPGEIAEIRRLLRAQGAVSGRKITMQTKSGALRSVLFSTEAIEVTNEACFLTLLFDITEREQAEQALQRSAERLRMLADASRTFAEAGSAYQALLDQVAQTITAGLGEGCAIRLLSDDGQWLPLVALYDVDPEKCALQRIIMDAAPLRVDEPSLSMSIIQSQQALMIPVVDQEQARAATKPEYWPLLERVGIHSMVGVPMRVQGRVIGALILHRRQHEQPPFDKDDLTLTQDLADRAALAIANAQLLSQVQRELAERTSAEAALRESEERLRTVTETAQVGLVIVDQAHRYRYANPAYTEIFHLPTGELVGQRVADVLAPVYEAQILPRLARAFAGEQVSYELVVPPAMLDALERFYAVTYAPGVHRSEPVVVVVVVEITVRKQAEAQLRYHANLLEQVSDAIISTDASFTIKSWNSAAEALYGWPAQEAIGKPLNEIVPTEYLGTDSQQVQARFLRDERWQGEVIQSHRDGSTRTIMSGVSLLKDRAGIFTGAVGINRDITDRKRAEQALQRAADRLQHLRAIDQAILAGGSLAEIAEAAVSHIGHLIPSTRVGVVLIDQDSQIVTSLALQVCGKLHAPPSVQAALAIFGAAIEPLSQGQVYHVADVAALPELPQSLRAAQVEQVRAYFHMPIMAGQALIALLNVGSDQPGAFAAEHIELAREVADQLAIAIQQARLRTQVAQHAQELEQRVVARTAELIAANQELEAFSYSVSHDLRAPLRAIDGFSRILLDEYAADLPDEAQHYFQLVRDNAQQMGQLVDDLLAFSRLSRQPLATRTVDMAALVRQCLDDLRAEQVDRHVTISIGALPNCKADPALLKQVWFNLIANALKYTRRRDPATIEISAQIQGTETIYFVKDNGVGFDMRYSDKLFGVFQRLHRAEDYAGTGVGLAIVQRIIHRHGGRVWADAAPEQGATFFFTLAGATP